jgi:hypothetical protein
MRWLSIALILQDQTCRMTICATGAPHYGHCSQSKRNYLMRFVSWVLHSLLWHCLVPAGDSQPCLREHLDRLGVVHSTLQVGGGAPVCDHGFSVRKFGCGWYESSFCQHSTIRWRGDASTWSLRASSISRPASTIFRKLRGSMIFINRLTCRVDWVPSQPTPSPGHRTLLLHSATPKLLVQAPSASAGIITGRKTTALQKAVPPYEI